jgi:Outer membrane protein beta-barrel domain
MIFSGANISEPSGNPKDVLRFTYGFNIGVSFNFNFSRHLGAYTGVDIKNIGFIEHNDGVTIKRRTYNIGAPVGIKIGNMAMRRTYVFFGGGVDAPFNYKEKHFQIRDQKTKFNEWFSDRTPAIMPYVFLGMAFKHGLTVKAQYYPNNYLNPDFTVNGVKPYAGYDVHLFMLSLGISMYYTKHHDMVKKDAVKMNTM